MQRLLVVLSGRDEGDVHPLRPLDLVHIDLLENQVIADTHRVIAAPVEALGRRAPEVADARESDADEAC